MVVTEKGWIKEGEVLNDWTFGRYRRIWQAMDENLTCYGDFSILQTENHPDKLMILAKGINGQELSRSDAERLVRNLSRWLEVGDETCPREGSAIAYTGSKNIGDEEHQKEIKNAVRKAAEHCDVEKAVLRIDRCYRGDIRWRFFVLWGRDIVYTDMMRFLDECRWVGEFAEFYCSEDAKEIEKSGDSKAETIYERPVPPDDDDRHPHRR